MSVNKTSKNILYVDKMRKIYPEKVSNNIYIWDIVLNQNLKSEITFNFTKLKHVTYREREGQVVFFRFQFLNLVL